MTMSLLLMRNLKLLGLAHDHRLEKHGWDCNVRLTIFKAAQYEVFDNIVAVIFSPKKRP